MILQLTPGSKQAGEAPEGWTVPVGQTLPNVNFDEILSALDTDTRAYLQLLVGGAADGLGGQGRRLSRDAQALRADRPRGSPGSTARCAAARRTSAARSTTSGCWPRRSGTRTTSSRRSSTPPTASSAPSPPRTRACARRCGCCPARSARPTRALTKADGLGDDAAAPTLGGLRPAARALGPTLRDVRPFLADTTPVIRDQLRPFSRDVPADRPRPAPGRPRPRGRDAAADDLARRRQPAAQRARLQPARLRGGLPLLDRVGQPRGRVGVRQPGRARADPPRPRRDVVLVAGAAAEHRPRQPGRSARSPACSTRRRRARSARARRGPERDAAGDDGAAPRGSRGRAADAEAGAERRPDHGHGRVRPVVLRADPVPAGSPSAARSRSSPRATASRSASTRPASSRRRPTSGSRASRSARSRRSTPTRRPAAPTRRSSSTRATRRCRSDTARCCARRRCSARPTSS